LLTVDEVIARILSRVQVLPVEDVPTPQALGRVLGREIVSDSQIPPFANSSMDGYAVRSSDVQTASSEHPIRLSVVADILAGAAGDYCIEAMQAARIMTGAPLPEGADAVIPVEHTDTRWSSDASAPLPDDVAIFKSVKPGDYTRPAGEDIQVGQIVLPAGRRLRPQDIGVLVSLGQVTVPVIRQPRVVILSSGDELVEIDAPLTPGKIRNSNSYMLAGLVENYGGIPIRLPAARDTLDDVRMRFQEALDQSPDMIISSAGVSVGTHDVVRTVIDELGEVELWRVNLRPGKPLAFGHVQNVPFWGLPGNPVSAMVTFELFARPALLLMGGRGHETPPMVDALVAESMHSDGRRSYIRVILFSENGQPVARTTGTQSSGALMSMVLADGLLIIPEGMTDVPAGSRLPVWLLNR
jgi:molybdopterin molybdotransferase